MKNELTTIIFAIALALLVTFVSHQYLNYKSLPASARAESLLYQTIEGMDMNYSDMKFRIRGERKTDVPVVLVAIDEDSLRHVGRWPWSRDLMSQLTQNLLKHGATGIGFDIIFSEPEKAFPENDLALAKIISEGADKIVLGTFNESQMNYRSFQDYCLNEAFLANGGDQMIKLNPTFVVEDAEDKFDAAPWNSLFTPLFANVQRLAEKTFLEQNEKKEATELSPYKQKYLDTLKIKSLYMYCEEWLTDRDSFSLTHNEALGKLYAGVFAKIPGFESLDPQAAITKFKQSVYLNTVPQSVDWTPNIKPIQEAAMYTASFNASLDADGYVRKYPLFYRTGNRLGTSYVPSLALQTYLISQGYRAELQLQPSRLNKQLKGVSQVKLINTKTEPETEVGYLPIDSLGRLNINYYGKSRMLPYVSAEELLSEEPTIKVLQKIYDPETKMYLQPVKPEIVKKDAFFKNRSVIVGATAEALYDLRNTPMEPNYPGPELHLTMLGNLIEGNFLPNIKNEAKNLVYILAILGIVLSLAWSYLGALASVCLFLSLFSGIIVFDYWLFAEKSFISSNVLLLAQVFLIYVSTTVFRYFTEERKKKELKSTFSKYVSPAIVDEVLKQPDNLKLGGRKQRMSVSFSDVRGFTTISEKLPPVELAQLLNDYLSPMTDLVFKNKGTLDKYMGDAIMSFFGAPIFYKDHAAHACRCALQSLDKLKELQKEFAARNLPMIDIGIGINTGEMSVGNMGSTTVQSYTVMGDSVNLASRLEGINKEYGTRIIISEFTYADIKEQFCCREVDRVRVKGKLEPVKIYEVLCEGKPIEQMKSWLDEYQKGYLLYSQKNFAEAKVHFEKTQALRGEDPLSEVYIERCNEYIADPPPADWDGVYVMKTK